MLSTSPNINISYLIQSQVPTWGVMRSALDMMTGDSSEKENYDLNPESIKLSAAAKLHNRYTKGRNSHSKKWETGALDAYVGLFGAAAKAAGMKGVSMRELDTETDDSGGYDDEAVNDQDVLNRIRILRIDRFDWAKRRGGDDKIEENLKKETIGFRTGVSLYTLLHLDIIHSMRADLFRMYLQLPLHLITQNMKEDVKLLPINIRYSTDESLSIMQGISKGHLIYYGKDGRSYSSNNLLHNSGKTKDVREDTILSEMGKIDIDTGAGPGRFSYVEYFSGNGKLSIALARAHPLATVISIEHNKAAVKRHLKRLRKLAKDKSAIAKLNQNAPADIAANNMVCRTKVDHALLKKVYESPEFFRYQIMGANLVDLMVTMTKDDFRAFVGLFLSTAMTSFFSVPSAAIISLAYATFFPRMSRNACEGGIGACGPSFDSMPALTVADHPTALFVNAETRFLLGLARAPGSTRIATKILPGSAHMVRADIINMTRQVNHHFDYQKDGHTRKYTMHIAQNTSAAQLLSKYRAEIVEGSYANKKLYEQEKQSQALQGLHSNLKGERATRVYLTRVKNDKIVGKMTRVIPYTSLYGITLITILRLGLVEEMRESAYHQFIALPLYEDMAPWNIVFQGAKMEYIDYDTKDKTFDHIVPLTYQALSVLFNYKRTVEDFHHCNGKARNPYGFSHISDCVGNGPMGFGKKEKKCDDSAKPVCNYPSYYKSYRLIISIVLLIFLCIYNRFLVETAHVDQIIYLA